MCTTNVGLISGLKVFLLVISCHVGFLGFFSKVCVWAPPVYGAIAVGIRIPKG
jgi:hypothetical protein